MQETRQSDQVTPASGVTTATIFDLAIFGGHGGGALTAVIFDRIAPESRGRCLGFLNDIETVGTRIGPYPVLGPFAHWRNLPTEARFAAPLHKAKDMRRRAAIVAGLDIPRERWANLFDPLAVVAGDVQFGVGTIISPMARVMASTRLGDHVSVQGGGQVSHNCTVEDWAFVGVNAVVCGWCIVREGSHIAPGAVIRDRITVGRYCVIGLGAVVVRDVPDGAIVAGNPARIIGYTDDAGAGSP